MAKIVWAPSALNDIDSICEYISRDSVHHASLLVDRIFEAADLLKQSPLIGSVIPEIGNPNCREVIYGSYRIMYLVEKNNVWITGVIHGARNWNPPVG